MPKKTIAHYHQRAEYFHAQYDSVATRDVHADWLPLLAEQAPGAALDVGAGSGRDAYWLAQQGWQVTAVEPAPGLRERGRLKTGNQVNWVDTRLPLLLDLEMPFLGYDLILLSAVWMHLPALDRPRALARLSELLARTGLLVITLRYGPSDPARPMYPVSTDELAQLAGERGQQLEVHNSSVTDCLQRSDVKWQTVYIQYLQEPRG